MIVVLLVAFLVIGSHAGHFSYSSLIWKKQGWSYMNIGFLWAISVVAEFIFFSIKKWKIHDDNLKKCLVIGIVTTSLRWFLQGYFIENYYLQILFQILHAISFAFIHTLVVVYMRINIDQSQFNQFQGLYFLFSFGLGFLFYTVVANHLFIHYNVFIMYSVNSVLSLLALFPLFVAKIKKNKNLIKEISLEKENSIT